MKSMHRPNGLAVLLLAALLGAGPALADLQRAASGDQKQERKAKKAVDDRADTRMRSDDVGKGTHFARKPLAPGAYFDDGNRAAVRKYYAAHPVRSCPPGLARKSKGCLPPDRAGKPWQIGQPLPSTVAAASVPRGVLVSLPKVPPGHRYVEVAGDILLVAAGSKMVVDGISGLAR